VARKAKPPVSAWIVTERKRLGWKVDDVSRRLLELGYDAQPSTVQVWEAGRSPRAETIEALERLFGSMAPRDQPTIGDLSGLVEAITQQTAAISALADALKPQQPRVAEQPAPYETGAPSPWPMFVRLGRTARGMSEGDLAVRLGTTRRNIERIEAGELEPSLRQRTRLVGLFAGTEEAKPVQRRRTA
jgi:ribosome-binding protein aMBF1 (putative translation factor)